MLSKRYESTEVARTNWFSFSIYTRFLIFFKYIAIYWINVHSDWFIAHTNWRTARTN